jgi:hypothetical protein
MSDMYERKPQNLTGPGGDQKELRVKYVDNGDGTWSLAVTPMSVGSGAATSAKQDTTNLKLDDIIEALQDYFGANTVQDLIDAINGISGGGTDPLAAYKYSDSATVSNVDYVGKLKADGDYLVVSYDAAGSALYKIGAAVDYVAGAGFGAWAAGLTGYDTYGDTF